ncbi:transposable element Tcb2 transposase [Trichonephila clavipes]|nr:transposable element Tcb2 transposase [Trichonephila clavipes]
MPPRRNNRSSNHLRSLNGVDYRPSRTRIFLSRNRSSCAEEQFHSGASLKAVDRRAPKNQNSGSGRRKVTSAHDDRHLLRKEVNDRTASSRKLAARWSTATGVLMPASSIRRRLLHCRLRARVPLYRISLTVNHRWLRLQWAREHRACAIGVRVPRNSSTVMRVWKQWTNEHQTARKTDSGRRKETSACDDRRLLRMAMNDRTASCRKLTARWSTATGVLISASSIRQCLLYRELRARVVTNLYGTLSLTF